MLAVAVAFTKVIIVCTNGILPEFEIRDFRRVFVVEYAMPKRTYDGLRYVPTTSRICCHLYAEFGVTRRCGYCENWQVLLVSLFYYNVFHDMLLSLVGIVEIERP